MTFYRKKWLWLLLLVLIPGIFLFVRSSLGRIEVKGYEVLKKDLLIGVTGTSTGTIKADREVKLTSQRIGRIAKLYVEEGSVVAAGQAVADLESDEVNQRLLLSSAQVSRLKAQLESMRLGLAAFRTEVESNIAKAKAVLDEADARLRRYQQLMEKGFISRSDLDAVRREHDVARESYAASAAGRGQIRAREEEIKAQESAVEQAEREHDLARIMYNYSFVRSPMAGIVAGRPVKLGETVLVGGLIASIVSPESLYIEAFIDEADVAKIAVNQPVNVTMDAYPEKTFRGEVYMISPVVLGGKQEARTFEVRVRLLDKGITVKPGMSADVEIIVSRLGSVLMIPSQAIIEKNENRHVYAVRNNRAELVQIRTGQFNWSFTEVKDGLREGDIVVMNPDVAGLKDRTRVRVSVSAR